MIRSISIRLATFAVIWWLISNGDPGGWLLGVPAIGIATWLSWRLRADSYIPINLAGVLRFLWFFILESFKGGLDVARRALWINVDVQPGFVRYRTQLPAGLPRVLLSSAISFLPGTLTVELNNDELNIHALALDPDPLPGVTACERRIARIFIDLKPNHTEAFHHV